MRREIPSMGVAREVSDLAVRERRILVVLSLYLPKGGSEEGDPLYEGGERPLAWRSGREGSAGITP